jgi:SAM-dependent methyltransferase
MSGDIISTTAASGSAEDIPNDFLARWRTSAPPLRPPPEVAAAIGELLPEHDRSAAILLLGVTPELAVLPNATVALDRSIRMIEGAWPGSSASRRAVRGDWRRMPFADASFAGAIGDGSFSGLVYPDEYGPLFAHLRRVVRPGGSVIIRCFASPEQAESVEEIGEAAMSGTISFHVFKLRFNMAAARERGGANVSSDEAVQRFRRLFPDRERLCASSGWSLREIAEMDAYEGCPDNHSYPRRSELRETLGAQCAELRFVEIGGYTLAENCPLLVARLP